RSKIWSIVGMLFFLIACWLLVRYLRHYRLSDIIQNVRAIPAWATGVSALMVLLDLLAVTQSDIVSLMWLGKPLSYKKVAFSAFLGNILGRTIGFPVLTSTGIQYRIYSTSGLSIGDVGQIFTYHFTGLWLGFMMVAGGALIMHPVPLPVWTSSVLW